MKNMFKLFAGLMIASFLFVACDKNNEPEKKVEVKKNFFKIGETEHDITGGVLVAYGKDDNSDSEYQYEGNNVELHLYSGDIKIEVTKEETNVNGTKGLYLFANLFSKDNTLSDGAYTFKSDSPYSIGNFDYAEYAFEEITNEDEKYVSIEDAIAFTVKKDGEKYEVTIAGVDEKGNTIAGYFKGEMTYYDYNKLEN